MRVGLVLSALTTTLSMAPGGESGDAGWLMDPADLDVPYAVRMEHLPVARIQHPNVKVRPCRPMGGRARWAPPSHLYRLSLSLALSLYCYGYYGCVHQLLLQTIIRGSADIVVVLQWPRT